SPTKPRTAIRSRCEGRLAVGSCGSRRQRAGPAGGKRVRRGTAHGEERTLPQRPTNRLTSFRRPESAQRRSLVDRPDELLNPTQGALVAGATSDESPPGQDSDGESNRTGRGYQSD